MELARVICGLCTPPIIHSNHSRGLLKPQNDRAEACVLLACHLRGDTTQSRRCDSSSRKIFNTRDESRGKRDNNYWLGLQQIDLDTQYWYSVKAKKGKPCCREVTPSVSM